MNLPTRVKAHTWITGWLPTNGYLGPTADEDENEAVEIVKAFAAGILKTEAEWWDAKCHIHTDRPPHHAVDCHCG